MLKNRLTELLKEAKKNGITATKIAEDLKISKTQLSGWCNGTRNPAADSLQKLADYFHVSVDYLLGKKAEADAVPQTPLSEQETKLIEAFRKLPPSTQIIVINFIADLANQGERKN